MKSRVKIALIITSIVGIMILLVNVFFSGNNVDSEDIQIDEKAWSKTVKLTYKDFKLTPDSSAGLQAESRIEFITDYKLLNGILTYRMQCVFIKSKSQMLIKTRDILSHEQIHFDMGELCMRDVRRYIEGCSGKNINSDSLQKSIDDIIEKWNHVQILYDKETTMPTDLKKQHDWNIKIAYELEQTKKYSRETGRVQYVGLL